MDRGEARRKWAREYGRTHREEERVRLKAYRERIKQEVLTHYGNGKFACIKCAESKMACLTLDHINGGGNRERQDKGLYGSVLYRWLRKQDYPLGYQTLCMNCQFVKQSENDEYYHNR